MIKNIIKFTISTQFLQDIERYHFLLKKSKLPQYQDEYIKHKEEFFNQLLQMNPNLQWKLIVENVYRDSDTEDPQLKELLTKYLDKYKAKDLFYIRQTSLLHLLFDENTMYSNQRYLKNTPQVCQLIKDYETRKIKMSLIPIYNLIRHIVLCERFQIEIEPINTFNLLYYNIEQSKDLQYITDFIYLLRNTKTIKVPEQIWILIFNQLDQKSYKLELNNLCQLLQLFAHLKIKAKVDIDNTINKIIKIYKQQQENDEMLLEIIRTVNILKAHKFKLSDLNQLTKICQGISNKLQGNREFDIFMKYKFNVNLPILNEASLNKGLSDLLIQDSNLLPEEQKTKLRKYILEQLPAITNHNTLKKCLVLSCRLWPNDVQIIQKCVREIRQKLQGDQKDTISLAVNSLHQLQIVQYPFINNIVISYLSGLDKFHLNPQEISSLFYFICSTLPSQSKKELLRIHRKQQKIDQNIIKILTNMVPEIQQFCKRHVLRIKPLYTIIDCYSKYYQYLKIDFKFLFEQIEFNLLKEMEIKYQCGIRIEQKDLDFLFLRFKYMQVGSRKLMRFFQKAKTNYKGALKIYLYRQKVYLNMRKKRKRSIRISKSF